VENVSVKAGARGAKGVRAKKHPNVVAVREAKRVRVAVGQLRRVVVDMPRSK